MTRILRYILQHDSGMAPCIDNGLVSLATCKPQIRASAKPCDWVLGFRPSPAPRGLVVWAGQIAESIGVGEYERRHSYKRRGGRADAIYRELPNGGFERLRPDYHPGLKEFSKDISAPVLIFNPTSTWYFGKEPQMLPEHLIHLAAGGRGHRVNGLLEGDAAALQDWLESFAPAGIHNLPRDCVPKKPRSC
jgi:Nucleotide modification associated domain 2